LAIAEVHRWRDGTSAGAKVLVDFELPAWIRRGGCALKRFREASMTRAGGVVD
jgi:hypothetical protein